MDCSPRLRCPWHFSGKNAGVGCHFLLQGIFLTQGSIPGLLYLCPLGFPWPVGRSGHCAQSLSHVFVTPWTVAHQAPLSMGFPRQEYWSGLPLPSPGALPNPGINPMSSASPMLAGRFFAAAPPGKPCPLYIIHLYTRIRLHHIISNYTINHTYFPNKEHCSLC